MFAISILTEIKESVVNRLIKAPTYLTYHNLAHTLDVTEQAARIATEEGVSDKNKMLLQVATLYHDIGYLEGPENHEARGCIIFADDAKTWNISSEEIRIVNGLILATKVPQTPKNALEQIICDADLDYLGREDFFITGEGLKREYLYFGTLRKTGDWDDLQLQFLQKHSYFTASQQRLREPAKQENIKKLKSRMNLLPK